jgi:hypothetical protein
MRKAWKEITGGREWIVDADLKDFFGSVEHEKLVVLVNSDLVDTLRVERLPFSHPNFSDMVDFGSGAGLLSRPCIPSNGGTCSSAPA